MVNGTCFLEVTEHLLSPAAKCFHFLSEEDPFPYRLRNVNLFDRIKSLHSFWSSIYFRNIFLDYVQYILYGSGEKQPRILSWDIYNGHKIFTETP